MSSIQHIQNKGCHQCSCYIFEMFLICRASTVHKHIQVSQQLLANKPQTQAISAHNIVKKDARGTPYTCEQNYGHQQHGQLCRAANSCQLRRRKEHYYTQDIEASLEYMQSTTLPHRKTAIQGPDQDKELYKGTQIYRRTREGRINTLSATNPTVQSALLPLPSRRTQATETRRPSERNHVRGTLPAAHLRKLLEMESSSHVHG
jgi:hypothetical protein